MCEHTNIQLMHKILRLTGEGKPDNFRLEIKLKCIDCNMFFNFKTIKMGVLQDQPTTGFDRSELRVPLDVPNSAKDN